MIDEDGNTDLSLGTHVKKKDQNTYTTIDDEKSTI